MYTARPNEVINIAGTIQPAPGTAGTLLSDAIPLDSDTGRRFLATVLTGTIGSSGTVDVSFVGATTSGGSYTIALTGSAITQDITGGNVHMIVIGTDWILANAPTAKFIKLKIVTAVAATPVAAIVQGFDCAHNPPTNNAAAALPTRTSSQVITTLA